MILSLKNQFIRLISLNDSDRDSNIKIPLGESMQFQFSLKDMVLDFARRYVSLMPNSTELQGLMNDFYDNIRFRVLNQNLYDFVKPGNKNRKGDVCIIAFPVDSIVSNLPSNKITCIQIEFSFEYKKSTWFTSGLTDGYYEVAKTDIVWFLYSFNPSLVQDFLKDCKKLNYKQNNNAFNFVYQNSFIWRINIPIELKEPQYKNQEENYRKSNGEIVRIASESQKEYKLESDYGDEFFHDALSIALLHEFITIDGDRYFQSTSYDIDWQEDNNFSDLAKATTKLLISPYNANSPNFDFV